MDCAIHFDDNTCPLCGGNISKKILTAKHIDTDYGYECNDCGYEFANEYVLQDGTYVHRPLYEPSRALKFKQSFIKEEDLS